MKKIRESLASLLMLGVSISLFGQMPVDNRTILVAMATNAKRVVQYEWKQRVTVIRKGKPSEPVANQIRFDSSGQMQRTTVSAPQQKQMGVIRGKIAAEVKENVKKSWSWRVARGFRGCKQEGGKKSCR